MTITKGKDSTVWDSNGKPYLDLQSGYWCNVLGYGNPDLIEPVKEQITRLTNVMSAFRTEEVEVALSELERILPAELNRVAFLNSGSEAVDLALKIARAATWRTGMVVNDRGYYGATTYPFSLSWSGKDAPYLPDPGEVHRLPPPFCQSCEHGSREDCRDFKCLEHLQSLVDEGNDNIAAVMYEPIAGFGILVPPIGYGVKLREYADALDALLISEEVTTAPGKTGRWFGFQHDGIIPDILVLGKAIGSGFPVSVVVTFSEVEERCGNALRHVQSHQNDALTGRIVGTVISVIREQGLVEEAARKGEYWLNALKELMEEFPIIVDVRGRGLMFGVQLSQDHVKSGEIIQEKLLEEGYLMDFHSSSSTFRFFPPYVITYEEIDSFMAALRKTLITIE
ncbi:MAG: aspartate aminotransferase family protein [Candidatus Bathyarchaeota archaeon]|nr:MAG: aspartate aminotransferase family protein [Candidatus Bathyarchaeota archaeon]